MRTDEQNRALHLYFRWVAEALAEKHIDFRDLKVEIQPTEHLVKELMWKPIQIAMYGKESTTKLEKSELSAIYDTLHRALLDADRFGVNVPFPNKEDLARDKADKQFYEGKK